MSLSAEASRAGIMPATGRLGGRLLVVAGAGLGLMVVVTGIDVVGRCLFNCPFGGAFEIAQMSLAALVFVALPLTTRADAHVEVDLALHLFSPRVQRWLGRFAAAVMAQALFALQLVRLGLQQMEIGSMRASLGLPLALAFLRVPIAFAFAFAFAVALVGAGASPSCAAPSLRGRLSATRFSTPG